MKIAVCARAVRPRDGTSHFAMQLADLLARGGHDVTMVVEKFEALDGRSGRGPRSCIDVGQARCETKAGTVHRIARRFREERFDVVFVCAGLPARYLEEALGLSPDDTAVVLAVVSDRAFPCDPVVRSSASWNVAVAISSRLVQSLQDRLPAKAVRLAATGVALPSEGGLAELVPLTMPLRLLFVGRLLGRKNVLMLPRILAACLRRGLPSTLTVCGYGPDREPLERACHEEGVAHLVKFPVLPRQVELYLAFRRHHVLLLTSSYGEGLGLVLLEGHGNGCVPVASRLVGVTDFAVEDGVTGMLAEAGNPESFAERIAATSDPDRWQRLSDAAAARTRRLFSLDEMERDYAHLIREIGQGACPLPLPRSELPRPRFRPGSYLPPALSPVAKLYSRLRGPRPGTANPDPE